MSLWTWIGGILHGVKVKIAPAVVGFLNVLSGLEESGIIDGIDKVIDTAFKTKVAENVNAVIKANILTWIAAWTGVETISSNASNADKKKFSDAIVAAVVSKKASQTVSGQVIEELGIQVWSIVQKAVGEIHEKAATAAQITGYLEEAYQDLQKDLADAQTNQADASS